MRILFIAIFLLTLGTVSEAFASVVVTARKSFIQGDLPGAVKILEPQLYPSSRIRGKELNDSLELYGITQFMLGNQTKAEKAFKQLLNINPSATLDKRYILDPAIEPYFATLKKNSSATKEKAKRRFKRAQNQSKTTLENPRSMLECQEPLQPLRLKLQGAHLFNHLSRQNQQPFLPSR